MQLTKSVWHIMNRVSLVPKMLFITILIGLSVSFALDCLQTKRLKDLFESDLSQKLGRQAQDDRIRFDNYVERYYRALKLIVSQRGFYQYVIDKKFFSVGHSLTFHSEIPSWLPDASVMRHLAPVQFAILMDDKGRVREVYNSSRDKIPQALLNPSNLLIKLSHNQSFTTDIEGKPFLLASEFVMDSQGNNRAILLLANHINDDFLIFSQELASAGSKVALVGGDPPKIIASSSPDSIMQGSLLGGLKNDYLITGKSFFDRGASDIILQFTSFISKKEFEQLNETIIRTERGQRIIISLSLILSFSFIMLWITKNIQKLTRHISDFSQNKLNMQLREIPKGDQLIILQNQFSFFTDEIIMTREKLKNQAAELLREKTVYLDNVLQSSTLAIIAADLDFRIKYYNATAEKFFGCKADEVIGGTIMEMHARGRADQSEFEAATETIRKQGGYKYDFEQEIDGETHIIESRVSGILDNENRLMGIMLISEDITERKRMEEELKRLSEQDPLTNIYNRRKFFSLMEDEIERSKRYERPLSLLMLDVDNFKKVNDTYGHGVGDRVLVTVADIANKIIRKMDVFARLGGEEFAIIVPETESDGSKALAEKIRNGVEDYNFNGAVKITVSIGVTEFKSADTVDSFLKRADVALYICKDNGRNRVEVLL